MSYIPGITVLTTNPEEIEQLLEMAKFKENWRITDDVGVPEQLVPVLGKVNIDNEKPELSVVMFIYKKAKNGLKVGWHKWINGYWYPLLNPMSDVICWMPGPSYNHLEGHIKQCDRKNKKARRKKGR